MGVFEGNRKQTYYADRERPLFDAWAEEEVRLYPTPATLYSVAGKARDALYGEGNPGLQFRPYVLSVVFDFHPPDDRKAKASAEGSANESDAKAHVTRASLDITNAPPPKIGDVLVAFSKPVSESGMDKTPLIWDVVFSQPRGWVGLTQAPTHYFMELKRRSELPPEIRIEGNEGFDPSHRSATL